MNERIIDSLYINKYT